MQSFPVHFVYNYLMDYYHNEQIVQTQIEVLQKSVKNGQKIERDVYQRLVIKNI